MLTLIDVLPSMERGRVVERVFKDRILNIPNLLTFARIALLPVIVWRFRMGDRTGALFIYLSAMLTDIADGVIARRTNQITSLGKLLDPIADKLSLVTVLYLFSSEGQIPGWMLHAVIVKEAAFIICSACALWFGIVVSALPVGKITTLSFVFSTTARFLLLRTVADALLMISLLFSCVAVIWYGAVFVRRFQTEKAIA